MMNRLVNLTMKETQNLFNYLWLSVSSVKFYVYIFNKHRDYGVRYIVNLALISALICIIGFFYKIHELERAFKGEIVDNLFKKIDYILKQIPDLEFDGQNITNNYPEAFIIKNQLDKPVLAIDPQNNMLPREREKLDLTVTKDKLIIKLADSTNLPIELKQLFGKNNSLITYDLTKQLIASMLASSYRVLTYIVFPLMVILVIINSFLDKALLILALFFVMRVVSKEKISMKSMIRLSMYSSGIYALFQLIFVFFLPNYRLIIWLVQSWTSILIILALLTINGKRKFLNW